MFEEDKAAKEIFVDLTVAKGEDPQVVEDKLEEYERVLADAVSAKEELVKALKFQKFIEQKVEHVKL